jgi:acyl-coenzyme A synthetase/AMP-(fatty) acid ligase
MLDRLAARRSATPDATAIIAATTTGWDQTTWTQLYDGVLAASAYGGRLDGRSTVVVRVDGTAAGAATVVGLSLAGVDVVLVEDQSSVVDDPRSAVRLARPSAVIGPADGRTSRYHDVTYEECLATAGGTPPTGRAGEVLQLTSGSTGEPRLARQPLANVLHGATTYRQLFGFTPQDEVFVAVPLAHSFGLIGGLFAALVSGARVRTLPRFGLRHLLDGLAAGATALLGTPLMYQLLAPVLPGLPGPLALRVALSSGGPLATGVAAEAGRGLGVPVRQIYGSTETGLIAYQPEQLADWPSDATGIAAPGVRLRVGEPDGSLFVQTPTLFTGYVGDDRPPAADYPTGDVARVDPEGRVFLLGRKNTFVNVGGRKVNPRRIERILAEHTGVRDAYVYGRAAPGQEERIHATVVLAPSVTAADVVRFCRDRGLAPYEVPHHVHVTDRLPRNAMGKVEHSMVVVESED